METSPNASCCEQLVHHHLEASQVASKSGAGTSITRETGLARACNLAVEHFTGCVGVTWIGFFAVLLWVSIKTIMSDSDVAAVLAPAFNAGILIKTLCMEPTCVF